MTALEKAPECAHDMHRYCSGPKVVRREGAPSWEAPLMTLRCDCPCHGWVPRSSQASRA